jgi:hypothetical protein
VFVPRKFFFLKRIERTRIEWQKLPHSRGRLAPFKDIIVVKDKHVKFLSVTNALAYLALSSVLKKKKVLKTLRAGAQQKLMKVANT